jgi:hypothetical protein
LVTGFFLILDVLGLVNLAQGVFFLGSTNIGP